MNKEDLDVLFNIVNKVGVDVAEGALQSIRDNLKDHDGNFLDGFDYAIYALQETRRLLNDMVKIEGEE